MDRSGLDTATRLATYLTGSFSNAEQYKLNEDQDTQSNSLNSVSDIHALVRLDILPLATIAGLSPFTFFFRQEIHINKIHMKRLRVLELVDISHKATRLRMHLIPKQQTEFLLTLSIQELPQQIVDATMLSTEECCNVTYYWYPEKNVFIGELLPRQCLTRLNGSAYLTVFEQIAEGRIEIAEKFFDDQDQQVFGIREIPYIYLSIATQI